MTPSSTYKVYRTSLVCIHTPPSGHIRLERSVQKSAQSQCNHHLNLILRTRFSITSLSIDPPIPPPHTDRQPLANLHHLHRIEFQPFLLQGFCNVSNNRRQRERRVLAQQSRCLFELEALMVPDVVGSQGLFRDSYGVSGGELGLPGCGPGVCCGGFGGGESWGCTSGGRSGGSGG